MAFMMPLLGQAGAAFAPLLLNKLFGGHDPNQAYRKNVNNIMAPENMARLTQGYYQQGLGSPAYSLAQRQIAAGTNASQNALAQRAAQSGVSNSGVGNLMGAIGPSLAGSQFAQLQANLYGNAQQQAQNNIQQQIGALGGQMPATQNQQYAGLGIAQLGPLLQQLMAHMARGGNPYINAAGFGAAGPNYGIQQNQGMPAINQYAGFRM